MPVSTEDLIRRHQQGQPGAFDALFERYKDYVYRVAFFITRHSGDAEEAVQEAFLDVLRALPRYDVDGPAKFETWLYRVTVNRCRSRHRRKRLPSVEWDDVSAQIEQIANGRANHNPERATVSRETQSALWAAVDELPEPHREVVVLRYQAGLSYKEIAQTLEIKMGTVKSRLYNAHKKLGGLLQPAQAGIEAAVEGGLR